MTTKAYKVAVIESEKGWGRKIDDWMVVLTVKDAELFTKEFNAKNTLDSAPDWYMQVEGEAKEIILSDAQFKYLADNKRVWLSTLSRIK